MINEEQIKQKWGEFRGGVRNLWGRISEEEIDQTKGNLSRLSALIQDKYGESKDSVKQKFDQLFSSFDNDTDKSNEKVAPSSYQRNPTAEIEDESSRNFNSSSSAVGGNHFETNEVYDSQKDIDHLRDRSRGNISGFNNEEDRIARH